MESFGQKETFTKRLQAILQDYPEGGQIIKELLQNADDAQAKNVKIILDHRIHSSESLIFPLLAKCQGPALLIQNDGKPFSKHDFTSISNTGNSSKRQDRSKTGKFGIGFNSVYHLSDFPSFVSGNYLVIFDPHNKSLLEDPDDELAMPQSGCRLLYREPKYSGRIDQLAPFEVSEDFLRSAEFPGTLFRLPLRTPEQATESDISKSVYTPEDIKMKIICSFEKEAHIVLLFLKFVHTITISEWFPDQPEPTCYLKVSIENAADVMEQRSSIARRVAESGLDLTQDITEIYPVAVQMQKGGNATTEQWIVMTNFKAGVTCTKEVKRIGWGGIAVQMKNFAVVSPVQGRAFCFLPLPIETSLPVHVNGYFDLSSNRRDLWMGSDLEGSGKAKAEWNESVLQYVLAPLYADLIEHLCASTSVGRWPDNRFLVWPVGINYDRTWDVLAKNTLFLLWYRDVFWSAADGGRYLKGPASV
eukprot:gene39661-52315_t